MGQIDASSQRYCRGCRYPVGGLDSRQCPECGRGFDLADPSTTLASAGTHWPTVAAGACRNLIALVAVACVVLFLLQILALQVETLFLPFWGPVCGLPAAPILLYLVVVALIPAIPLTRRQRVWALILPMLFVSMALTLWPLRLMFVLHKPWWTSLADRVQRGETIAAPGRVGLLRYMSAKQIDEGQIGFQLTGWAGGGTFLVRRPSAASFTWYNPNWELSLGDGWYLVEED